MASAGGNISPLSYDSMNIFTGSIIALAVSSIGLIALLSSAKSSTDEAPGPLRSLLLFVYGCFLKPHEGNKSKTGTQQDALESFYKAQAGAYDVTRRYLLKGREEMLALVAAQLRAKVNKDGDEGVKKLIWVDVCLGIPRLCLC